jgi:hypothetical protein
VGRSRGSDLQWMGLAALTITGFLTFAMFVGADSRWLAALGDEIAANHAVPAGLPFAPLASQHWPNAVVLAELSFHALVSTFGNRGLMLAQVMALGIAFVALLRDAMAGGARREATVTALGLAAAGAVADLVTTRAQLYSIALLPILVALLRRDSRSPSWRIWLVVPMLAVWSNLHGAALIGLGITAIYLMLGRGRLQPVTASAVLLTSTAALLLTPAGMRTASYYYGVLSNVAAQRGEGMWMSLSLSSPVHLLLIAAAVVLTVYALRSRPQLWELIVILALAVMTARASRSGVWLLFFLAPLSARAFKPRAVWDRILPAAATAALVALILAVVRGPLDPGASGSLIARTIDVARGSPVLADDVLAEQIALAGGKIWGGNPIDAFSRRDQTTYLDWLEGDQPGARALRSGVDVVLTGKGGVASRLMRRVSSFRLIASDRTAALYVRVGR